MVQLVASLQAAAAVASYRSSPRKRQRQQKMLLPELLLEVWLVIRRFVLPGNLKLNDAKVCMRVPPLSKVLCIAFDHPDLHTGS